MVSKDVPGFVSNALLMPFINEIIWYLMQIISNITILSDDNVFRNGKDWEILR